MWQRIAKSASVVRQSISASLRAAADLPGTIGAAPFRINARTLVAARPLADDELRQAVDSVNRKFAEAREEIELALEARDTVYFNEEAEAAKEVVSTALSAYDALLQSLGEDQRSAIQRSMGLKMEQLKGELEQLQHD